MKKTKVLRMKDVEMRRRVQLLLCAGISSMPFFVVLNRMIGSFSLAIIAAVMLGAMVARMLCLRRREARRREAWARALARRLELSMAKKGVITRDRRAISTFKMNW
jgi:hypothetical protein